jgi:Ca-activated chloride channel family protein
MVLLLVGLALNVGMMPRATQTPRPALRIVSPGAETYVVGATTLRADADDSVAQVAFYADGELVCTIARPPFSCEWTAGATVIAHQIRAVGMLRSGGRAIDTVRTKALDYAESVSVDRVQVTATVTGGGRFVRGLPQTAFHLSEDGRPQQITHFDAEQSLLDLTLAVDISGSMAPHIKTLKTAVSEFLKAVRPSDQVTLLGFNDSIFTLAKRETDPEARVRAVEGLAPWGTTALYDVIIRAVEMAGNRTGRKAIVVFTDGEDNGSHATLADVERRLMESDVTLYFIGQGQGTKSEALKKILSGLADRAGGRALFTDKIDSLRMVFGQLLEELSNQYLLGYSSSNTRDYGAVRRIKLDVDGGYTVRARKFYTPKARQP